MSRTFQDQKMAHRSIYVFVKGPECRAHARIAYVTHFSASLDTRWSCCYSEFIIVSSRGSLALVKNLPNQY